MGATVGSDVGTGVGTGAGDCVGVGVGDGVGVGLVVGVGVGVAVGEGIGVGEAVGAGWPGGGPPPGPPLRGRAATMATADARTRMTRVIWKPAPGCDALTIGSVVELNMMDRWSIARGGDHIGPQSELPMRHTAMLAETDRRIGRTLIA